MLVLKDLSRQHMQPCKGRSGLGQAFKTTFKQPCAYNCLFPEHAVGDRTNTLPSLKVDHQGKPQGIPTGTDLDVFSQRGVQGRLGAQGAQGPYECVQLRPHAWPGIKPTLKMSRYRPSYILIWLLHLVNAQSVYKNGLTKTLNDLVNSLKSLSKLHISHFPYHFPFKNGILKG